MIKLNIIPYKQHILQYFLCKSVTRYVTMLIDIPCDFLARAPKNLFHPCSKLYEY